MHHSFFTVIKSKRYTVFNLQKRLFEDLVDIDDTTGVADVQFGITTLSPLKKSRKGADYYEGVASDGTKITRLVTPLNTLFHRFRESS